MSSDVEIDNESLKIASGHRFMLEYNLRRAIYYSVKQHRGMAHSPRGDDPVELQICNLLEETIDDSFIHFGFLITVIVNSPLLTTTRKIHYLHVLGTLPLIPCYTKMRPTLWLQLLSGDAALATELASLFRPLPGQWLVDMLCLRLLDAAHTISWRQLFAVTAVQKLQCLSFALKHRDDDLARFWLEEERALDCDPYHFTHYLGGMRVGLERRGVRPLLCILGAGHRAALEQMIERGLHVEDSLMDIVCNYAWDNHAMPLLYLMEERGALGRLSLHRVHNRVFKQARISDDLNYLGLLLRSLGPSTRAQYVAVERLTNDTWGSLLQRFLHAYWIGGFLLTYTEGEKRGVEMREVYRAVKKELEERGISSWPAGKPLRLNTHWRSEASEQGSSPRSRSGRSGDDDSQPGDNESQASDSAAQVDDDD